MPQKHIIIVHGRGPKPSPRVLGGLLKRALITGLARVDRDAARAVEDAHVKTSLAYYGDLCNDFLVKAEPSLGAQMVERRGRLYEKPDRDADDLERLLERLTSRHTKEDYARLLKQQRNRRFLDDVMRVVSPIASITGLGVYAISRLFPDLGAYLLTRRWGSPIRSRLQERLRPALARGDDVTLLTHSMGSIVAYDVLWKLSRLSEYRQLHEKKVSLWLTVGSPLGDSSIRGCLYDSNEGEDGRYPANVHHWVNVAAQDDFVAHDGTAADDFNDMMRYKLVQRVYDLPRIQTFWVGEAGVNPHKVYGYLNHPAFARVLASWIRGGKWGRRLR
jgi:hypothetical protein